MLEKLTLGRVISQVESISSTSVRPRRTKTHSTSKRGEHPGKQAKDVCQREKELAQIIVAYLVEHPQATDTLEGIAEWWIMRQQVRVETNRVANALQRLTESGFLEKNGEGSKALYCLRGSL